ncbi:hypothetical protein MtrunA17_Chr7g0227801 [Medicago truncatula]|uniref:Uncharacterized protein n=1 Tax=Medicago truncatula TaxID=3880 RepID=A0A396GVZ4_MEDTR|nr:hypothetical protein MtrunA17_Chr7g0227801 [Medicago truncatula]
MRIWILCSGRTCCCCDFVCEEREIINKKGRSNDERERNHVRDRNIKGQQGVQERKCCR